MQIKFKIQVYANQVTCVWCWVIVYGVCCWGGGGLRVVAAGDVWC